MALRLEIISNQRQALGPLSSIVLGVSGGSIGRALDNDWALPDPRRYLSGLHARIHVRQGGYYLEDCSTNGVFVNDAASPQGRRGLYALRDGDVLRMGEYRIRVGVDADDGALPRPGTHTMAQMAVDNVVPLRAVGGMSDDLGASLNIEALMPVATCARPSTDSRRACAPSRNSVTATASTWRNPKAARRWKKARMNTCWNC